MTGYRLAKKEYGPLNPLPRDVKATLDEKKSWGRFDVPGVTIYAAGDPATAIIEALAWVAQSHDQVHALQKTANQLGMSLEQLLKQVAEELDENDAMSLGAVPAGWRLDREIYTLQISPHWLVDLTSADTIGAINERYLEPLTTQGIIADHRRITLSDLTGDTRAITQFIADQIKGSQLYGDPMPDGLVYPSKLGAVGASRGRCFALWPSENITITVVGSQPITEDAPGIKQAQKLHGIRIY